MALQQGWQEISDQVSRLIARAWLEPEFEKSFITDPRGTLEAVNITIPEGVEVQINQFSRLWSIEASPDMQGAIWKIPLPPKPTEVTDEALRAWTDGEETAATLVRSVTGCCC